MLDTTTRHTSVLVATLLLTACAEPEPSGARRTAPTASLVADAASVSGGTPLNVNATNESARQAETSIAVSRANPAIMVGGAGDSRPAPNNDKNCGYMYSNDGGTTWKGGYLKGITRNTGGPLDYDKGADPAVAYSVKHNTFHFVCLATDVNTARSAIVHLSSSDGGKTWSAPQVIASSNSTTTWLDKEYLAIDNVSTSPWYGRIHVVWQRNSSSGKIIQASYLNGTTWSTPVTVSSPYFYGHDASVAVGANGAVFIAFCWANGERCSGGFDSIIFVTSSLNGGASWTVPVIAATFTSVPDALPGNSFRLSSYPVLSVNPVNGIVHLVFTNYYAGSGANIQYTRSTTMGLTWDPPMRINSRVSDDQFAPWMATTPGGSILWVCYYDQSWNSGTELDVSCSRSTTGTSFEPAIRVSSVSSPSDTFIGDYIGLDVTPTGGFRVLWTDYRTGNGEAYTAGK